MAFDPKWTVGWTLDELKTVAQKMDFRVNVLDIDDNPTPLKRVYLKYVLTQTVGSLSPHINVKVKTLPNSKTVTSYVVSHVYSLQYLHTSQHLYAPIQSCKSTSPRQTKLTVRKGAVCIADGKPA